MKKLLVFTLALAMLLGMMLPAVAEGGYKIAILTGTTSQGEEEYRAAERLAVEYPDVVITDTYPDNFSSEVETTIGKLLQFAENPEVKAIIMCQAVQGATAAFTKIRETRPDILLIAGVAAEDPADIAGAADLVMGVDEINGGYQIVGTAKEWGAEVLVHYSFARHMGYETIVARYNIMKEEAELAGIELVFRDAPDPTGDAGMTGAQTFILSDVPKVMEEYAGKKVAFFTTNCGMQEPLQAAVLKEANALYPLPCCPSPFHGFPSSLELEVEPEEWGNVETYLRKMAARLNELGAINRVSTWPVGVNMSIILGGFEYAKDYIENGGERVDLAKLHEVMTKVASQSPDLTTYVDADGNNITNYFMIFFDRVDFNDYL
ncbi:MAG TPA: DUF3798 domain-containing protein [Clostridia bacterium]|jgi:hypothetical protein|nr:DUF3798 domain-containing protein [Clostridia bacterium]HPY43707.1 DUF3798 domain-containing protein [Clostridia bacterium]HQA98419.1 DUF3798 domain-containing protein [Clostridia bacterium]HQO55714.1 DUF3798 domain-containing protein [Clostridia bacterium]HUM61346.1 DUF3798 domain-containing protein [Clostridia bacterium]